MEGAHHSRRRAARALARAVAALVLVLAACAGGAPGADGTAAIGVRHAGTDATGPARVVVRIDGRRAGVLGPGCSLRLPVEPGRHAVRLDWAGGSAEREVAPGAGAVAGFALTGERALVPLAETALPEDRACPEPAG
mgnify:CR=1 FL=1